jgi:hypothetical protein
MLGPKLNVVDITQALIDGASYVTLMASKKDETALEAHVKMVIAQTQLVLQGLQAEASGMMAAEE